MKNNEVSQTGDIQTGDSLRVDGRPGVLFLSQYSSVEYDENGYSNSNELLFITVNYSE